MQKIIIAAIIWEPKSQFTEEKNRFLAKKSREKNKHQKITLRVQNDGPIYVAKILYKNAFKEV